MIQKQINIYTKEKDIFKYNDQIKLNKTLFSDMERIEKIYALREYIIN